MVSWFPGHKTLTAGENEAGSGVAAVQWCCLLLGLWAGMWGRYSTLAPGSARACMAVGGHCRQKGLVVCGATQKCGQSYRHP